MSRTREFKLDEKQTARVDAWFKHHFEVIHAGQKMRDMGGSAVKFIFLPTSMGNNVTVECIWCKEGDPAHSVVLTTDFDNEDFIYEYDENWNRLKASWER